MSDYDSYGESGSEYTPRASATGRYSDASTDASGSSPLARLPLGRKSVRRTRRHAGSVGSPIGSVRGGRSARVRAASEGGFTSYTSRTSARTSRAFRSETSVPNLTRLMPHLGRRAILSGLGAPDGPSHGSIYRRSDSPGPGAYSPIHDTDTATPRRMLQKSRRPRSPSSSVLQRVLARSHQTPGPGAHDAPSEFGRVAPGLTATSGGAGTQVNGLAKAPSFSFGSAKTGRDPMDRARYGLETKGPQQSYGSAALSGGGSSPSPRRTLARVGSNLARSIYLGKDAQRENIGSHSPGPAVYTQKSSFILKRSDTYGVGFKADSNRIRSSHAVPFGTASRF